jgi:hypothetical protein
MYDNRIVIIIKTTTMKTMFVLEFPNMAGAAGCKFFVKQVMLNNNGCACVKTMFFTDALRFEAYSDAKNWALELEAFVVEIRLDGYTVRDNAGHYFSFRGDTDTIEILRDSVTCPVDRVHSLLSELHNVAGIQAIPHYSRVGVE